MRQLRDGQQDSYRLSKRHLHADGSVLHADVSVSAIRNVDGSDYGGGPTMTTEYDPALNRSLHHRLG